MNLVGFIQQQKSYQHLFQIWLPLSMSDQVQSDDSHVCIQLDS